MSLHHITPAERRLSAARNADRANLRLEIAKARWKGAEAELIAARQDADLAAARLVAAGTAARAAA